MSEVPRIFASRHFDRFIFVWRRLCEHARAHAAEETAGWWSVEASVLTTYSRFFFFCGNKEGGRKTRRTALVQCLLGLQMSSSHKAGRYMRWKTKLLPIRQRIIKTIPPLFPAQPHRHNNYILIRRRTRRISLENHTRAEETADRACADWIESLVVSSSR